MARSQVTFSKRENEKKRAQRKKEKAEKREERKSNSDKGKSFEDMLMYVDQDGNLVESPPDPKDRKKIKAEDIELGVPKQQEIDPADLVRRGTVTFYNASKGYGFIRDHESQESVFVHANGLQIDIAEQDRVSFETVKGPKGLQAVNVRK
ncbi:MAG: cold-shock protein [Bacteroidia bacterium]